jgi:hypothetical protein
VLTRRRIVTLARAFDRETVPAWRAGEGRLKARLRARRQRGALYLTRTDLVWLAEWKSPRIRPLIARNTAAGVRGVTAAAFLVPDEGRRLQLLLGLSGVGVPVASVVLHFADPSRYPVYDVRVLAALRRLGVRGASRRRRRAGSPTWLACAAWRCATACRSGPSTRPCGASGPGRAEDRGR